MKYIYYAIWWALTAISPKFIRYDIWYKLEDLADEAYHRYCVLNWPQEYGEGE
jgi:hypothetical protein